MAGEIQRYQEQIFPARKTVLKRSDKREISVIYFSSEEEITS
jgi:hypothetical protein